MLYVGFTAICDFRHPVGVLEHLCQEEGGGGYCIILACFPWHSRLHFILHSQVAFSWFYLISCHIPLEPHGFFAHLTTSWRPCHGTLSFPSSCKKCPLLRSTRLTSSFPLGLCSNASDGSSPLITYIKERPSLLLASSCPCHISDLWHFLPSERRQRYLD